MPFFEKQQSTLRVVLSHAPEDKNRARHLYEQLRVVGITPWLAKEDLRAGQNIPLETSKQIRLANVVIILLSRWAMEQAGSFWRELNLVLDVAEEQREGTIFLIPLRLEECEMPERLRDLKSVDWFETGEGFDRLIKALLVRGEELGIEIKPNERQPALPDPLQALPMPQLNPYQGLFAFQEIDARFFFGRDGFVEQLSEVVRQKSLIAIIGPSGSGKSSVVFAGLVPWLRRESRWRVVSFRPGVKPFQALATILTPLLEDKLDEFKLLAKINENAVLLQRGQVNLPQIIERFWEKQPQTNLLLVGDQFEELYTLCKEEGERQAFLNFLLAAIQRPPNGSHQEVFRLVLTLRADFFGYALSYRPFADALQEAQQNLGPMNLEELQEVVEQPAELLGVEIDEGLSKRILEAVSQAPGNLPLLEFALTLLWDKRLITQDGQIKLTHSAYEEIGGVTKAIAQYADEQFKRFTETERQKARRIFVQLVQPGAGTQDTRRVALQSEIGQENWELVNRIANARLVVTNQDPISKQGTVELIHEALLIHWKQLQDWVEADRIFLVWQERLRLLRFQWENTVPKRDKGALLQGALFKEAQQWLQKRPADLSKADLEYIQVSQKFKNRKLIDSLLPYALILAILVAVVVLVFLNPLFLQLEARNKGEAVLVPYHPATSKLRYFERYEVTNYRYRLCWEAHQCTEPAPDTSSYFQNKPDLPVTGITAYQAYAFCRWLNRRLPTVEEWYSVATRGKSTQLAVLSNGEIIWPWSENNENPEPDNSRAYLTYSGVLTPTMPARVGPEERKNGMSDTGIYDLIGNVSEWTVTPFNTKLGKPIQGEQWDGSVSNQPPALTVVGGSFRDTIASIKEGDSNGLPGIPSLEIGFRCVEDE